MRAIRQVAGEARDAAHASRAEIGGHLSELGGRLERLEALANSHGQAVAQLATRVDALETELQTGTATARAEHRQLVEILRFVLAHGPQQRERLRRLRESPGYQLAYTDADPLVSVVIPTYDNHDTLGGRAIPSVLAQSYQNFEVVVVGDAAPDEARAVVEGFADPRMSFFNLPYRGPYPSDPETLWLVAGAAPVNEALRRARGSWIALIDDDDAFRPDHVERLLGRARTECLELVYSPLQVQLPNAPAGTIGRFPPEHGQFGMQGAIWHAGLADIFQYELADGALGLPTDWGLCQRMMEAGVRIGSLDEATVDYYPATYWRPAPYEAH